jgi:cytochrome P450
LEKEVNSINKSVLEMTTEEIGSLKYLTAFLKEVQRMYGPAQTLLNRMANKDHYVEGVLVKEGTQYATFWPHFSPKYYKDPENFNPDRWLTNENPPAFTFDPFSCGPKVCVAS